MLQRIVIARNEVNRAWRASQGIRDLPDNFVADPVALKSITRDQQEIRACRPTNIESL